MKAGKYRPDKHPMNMARSDRVHMLDSPTCFDQQQNPKAVSVSLSYYIFRRYVFERFRLFPKTPSHARTYYIYIQISALINLLEQITIKLK